MSASLKIAVLGCGYVGTEFARQARAAGHDVLGVVRSEDSRDKLRAEGISAEAFDIQATILNQLGFDHEKFTFESQGRPFRLTDLAGKVITDIIA